MNLINDSITRRWLYISDNTAIPLNEFLTAINMIVDSTYFTFNKNYYKQIFGTPVGSPLSPILADIVLEDVEEAALDRLPVDLPFYFRYIDDILLAAPRNSLDLILETFNSFHTRLKFTIEVSREGHISFLDVNLIVENRKIIFDLFKKTY